MSPPDLTARTRATTGGADLLGIAAARPDGVLFRHPGFELAGYGVALRIELPDGLDGAGDRVAEALAAIAVDGKVGHPGGGPVAIGALPFDPAAPAHVVVPEVLVGRAGDLAWVTRIARDGEEPAVPTAAAVTGPAPDGFSLTSPIPHEKWLALVDHALADIDAGRLEKVVLAREVLVEANQPIPVGGVLERLTALYPSCYTYRVDGFVGASPELLVARRGASVRSHPLAGTFGRSGDPVEDERLAARLRSSAKDRWEHQLLVDAIRRALEPVCRELHVPQAPSVLPLRNVIHLGTEVSATLRPDAPAGRPPSALHLVERLHPTPAVAGTPTDDALAWLAQCEGMERGRYAGPVGWVDAAGDGEWAIGIRCAEIDGALARLFAGVGLVTGSDPEAELAETQLKLQALLAALVRP